MTEPKECECGHAKSSHGTDYDQECEECDCTCYHTAPPTPDAPTDTGWEEEFDSQFNLATIIEDGTNPAYITYRGSEFSSVDNLLEDIRSFITKALSHQRSALLEELRGKVIEQYKSKWSHTTRDYTDVDEFRDDILALITNLKELTK